MKMYAIVETGGLQFRVERNLKIRIPKLEAEAGSEVSLKNVLALADGDRFLVGMPHVKEAEVKGRLLGHGRHRKLIIYKYKKRKNYRRKRGHRQDYSELLVTDIVAPESMRKEAVPRAAKPKAPGKKVAKKDAVAAKPGKPARVRAKPVSRKKVAERKPAVRRKVTRRAAPKPHKKTSKQVMGRLRRKKKE